MAVINIDDAYILNETGAQVDKVTGLYFKDESTSAAEKAFAQLNIGTAGSNRNLLDNPFFTVRQRGNGPFTGTSIHSADRWKSTSGNPTVNLLSPYGIQIVNTTNSSVDQYLSYTKEDLDGKTVTLSVLSDDGITSGTGTFDASSNSYTITFTFGSGKWYCRFGYFSSVHARPFIRIANVTSNESTSVNIYAIKLELGSVSTLANDAPPEYATELRKCQYYYREFVAEGTSSIGLAWAYSATGASMLNFFGLGNNMRTKPTAAYSGGFNLQTQRGTSLAVTEVRLSTDITTSIANVNFIVASGLTANQPCRVTANAGAKITFSADL